MFRFTLTGVEDVEEGLLDPHLAETKGDPEEAMEQACDGRHDSRSATIGSAAAARLGKLPDPGAPGSVSS